MTRYESAMVAWSTWLAKARAPSGGETTRGGAKLTNSSAALEREQSAARHTRKLMLPPSWERHAPVTCRSRVIRLWRAMGGGGRHDIGAHQ